MSFLTSRQKKSFLALLLGLLIISCIPYGFLAEGDAAFPFWSGLYLVQFLIYGEILFLFRDTDLSLRWIWVVAILARTVLIFTEPTLENDYWRYLWDGRVLANGINPYTFKPLDPALDHLEVSYRHLIGWKQYGTIYPPFSILVFAITHLIAGDSLIGLKIALTLFDLGTGAVLFIWFKRLGISPKWSALYFFNPLVLKETANSGHLDSIAVFFSALAAFLMWRSGGRFSESKLFSLSGWTALAMAVASKIYPICFVPLFFKVDRSRWLGVLTFSGLLLIAYSPFLTAGFHMLNGTEAFARHWIFNASFYRFFQNGVPPLLSALGEMKVLSEATVSLLLREDRLAKALVALVFGVFTLYRTRKIQGLNDLPKELVNVVGALLILSPVVNAWYVLWIVPFICITRHVPWLAFTYLVFASYSWWYSRELALYLRWFEYVAFFSVFVFWYYRRKEKVDHPNQGSL